MDNFLQDLIKAFEIKHAELDNKDSLEAAIERLGAHNHVRIEHEFSNSQFFQDRLPSLIEEYNKHFTGVPIQEMGNAIHEYNKTIGAEYNRIRESQKDLEEYSLEQMKEFIELFARHYGISYVVENNAFRFPIQRDTPYNLQEVINGYSYLFYPEGKEEHYFQETLAGVWNLIHVGLAQYALPIMERIDQEGVKYFETGKTIYSFLDYEPHWARFGQSSDWASAWIHRQMGNTEAFIGKLNSIINRHPLYTTDDKFTVFWHTGLARILEAAVVLYETDPSEANKLKLNKIFKYNHSMECQEHTESLREMLMAIYSYANRVYNYAN